MYTFNKVRTMERQFYELIFHVIASSRNTFKRFTLSPDDKIN